MCLLPSVVYVTSDDILYEAMCNLITKKHVWCYNVWINGTVIWWRCLTVKQLGNLFQNVIIFSNVFPYTCNISVWNWYSTNYLVNIVGTDGLVLYHQVVSLYSDEYSTMGFQLFMS